MGAFPFIVRRLIREPWQHFDCHFWPGHSGGICPPFPKGVSVDLADGIRFEEVVYVIVGRVIFHLIPKAMVVHPLEEVLNFGGSLSSATP